MPVLTKSEMDAFLDAPGILLRIGVNRANGFPLVTPIWFIYQDNAVYFTPREKSEWFDCLRDDNRISLCIDEDAQPYRKVIAEGLADLIFDVGRDDEWRDLYLSIASRYVPQESAKAYVQNTINEPRGLYRVDFSQTSIKSWRMPRSDEEPMGIWHQRYYQPKTHF